jgi:hypothetical protein
LSNITSFSLILKQLFNLVNSNAQTTLNNRHISMLNLKLVMTALIVQGHRRKVGLELSSLSSELSPQFVALNGLNKDHHSASRNY